ncbi:MAG: Fis family transcriptional regulator [Desulfuromonas sp.]|nr:MAG: Fis family transcriptional regulator [Desulfuromonas sp.]
MKTILIIDDENSIRESLTGVLQDEGYRPISAEDGLTGIETITEESPDLILLDIWMPGIDGLETLQRIREKSPELPVIMMSGHGTIETAVKATRLGAYDFIEKPLSLEKLLLAIRNALQVHQLVEENRTLRARLDEGREMVGQSPALQALQEKIDLVAPSSGWVLITGENGTGKELVARAIHRLSQRTEKPFVEVNCAAIPEELIESELFGHEKGAFTGATSQRKGKFDQAHQGTLFLDEIGDMSLKTQAKVLRILQEHKFERVGGNKTIEVDVRVIAATNKDLEVEIQNGQFREDLYYRLNVLPLTVPPLRERHNDIPELAAHFLTHFCRKERKEIKSLSPETLQIMLGYNWPGNVRELKNLIERLVIMTPQPTIEPEALPPNMQVRHSLSPTKGTDWGEQPATLREARELFEREYLQQKLAENDWNISRTAEAIDVERSNLHRKIKALEIEVQKGESS